MKTQTRAAGKRRAGWWMMGAAALACLHLAVPSFPESSRSARSNEDAALATLRSIVSAEHEYQAAVRLDRDGDGIGEFCHLDELVRDDSRHPYLLPTVFSVARELHARAHVSQHSGYLYLTFVPESDRAESCWCCYAWPAEAPVSGKRAYFVDQDGVVLATDNSNERYSGIEQPPALNALESDGQAWVPVR